MSSMNKLDSNEATGQMFDNKIISGRVMEEIKPSEAGHPV